MTYRMVDLIQKKKVGEVLSKNEINWMIAGYVSGQIADYQMSALAMAVYFTDMTDAEIANLTQAMIASGQQVNLSKISGVKVDKHSTGGVGDKVSLVLAPLVASFGVPVAKMSGRGLGHTGGTIDKLESIPGFKTNLSIDAFVHQIQNTNLAIISQSDDLVVADKLLYALRDVTATVDVLPLIASSIMAKKIASGSDAILLDVTVGNGAFMTTLEEARRLAQTMVKLGNAVGRKTIAVLTDMSQPLGEAIGNRNEIIEAVHLLQGEGQKATRHFIARLAQLMLSLAGKEIAIPVILEQLKNGKAYAKFIEFVEAQGGDPSNLTAPLKADYQEVFLAEKSGFIQAEKAKGIGLVAMKLGAGRATKEDSIDFEAGINLFKKVGEPVKKGEMIATLLSNRPIGKELLNAFAQQIEIGDAPLETNEIIEIIQ